MNPFTLNGIKVHISHPVESTREIKRTWKERWFTLPFTPFTKYKEISILCYMVEDGEIIQLNGELYMNNKTWREVSDSVKEKR